MEATGVWGRAHGVCNICLLRDNHHNPLSNNMLPRRAVACKSNTFTSSRCREYLGILAGRCDCLKAAVAAMDSPPPCYHVPGETRVLCSNTLIPADRTAASRQAHVPSWQVEATIRPSALRMRLLERCVTMPRIHKGRRVRLCACSAAGLDDATRTAAVTGLANPG